MTTTTFYDTPEGAATYTAMAAGFDGRAHIARLGELLPPESEVLEIGMGPGVDLDLLADRFTAVGSDLSPAFISRYAERRPDATLLRLDAITIDTDQRFDAIYSNKVLHHLTIEQMRQSLERQAEIIRPGGLLLHGLWVGTTAEDRDGLHDQGYMPDTFAAVVPDSLKLVACDFYDEMDTDDSLRVILRPRYT